MRNFYFKQESRLITDADVITFTNAQGESEKFGRGDFDNPEKLAEAGVIPAVVEETLPNYTMNAPVYAETDGVMYVTYPNKQFNAATAQAAALLRINALRKQHEEGGMTVEGTVFDTDIKGRSSLGELLSQFSADPTFTTEWKGRDPQTGVDKWVTMDATLYAAIRAAGLPHVQGCFNRQKELAEAVALAETQEAIDALLAQAETGWPGQE